MNLLVQLLEDLTRIHEDADLRLGNIDDKVLKCASDLSKDKPVATTKIQELRLELWSSYNIHMIKNIDKLLLDLSRALVQVKRYKTNLNQYSRDFEKIKDDADSIDEHIKIFYNLIKLWNEIADIENDLRSEAHKNFLVKIYLPFLVVVSGVYWYITTQAKLIVFSNEQTIFWFIVTLSILYFALKRVVQRN